MVRSVRSSICLVFRVFFSLLLVTAQPLAQDIGARTGHEPLTSDPALNEEAAAVLYRPIETKILDLNPNTRTIRILIHYGRTEFFVANGKPYGIECEVFSEYEKYLNRNGHKHSSKIGIVFIPVRFEDLIPYLLEGKGDIAAGLLTVTEERKKKAVFTIPYLHNVEEVLVAHSAAPQPKSLDDLSGKAVHVLRGSSFVQHLNTVNRQFSGSGRAPIKVVEMPASANADDILEMVNAGIFPYTFADDFVAELWSHVLPDIRVINNVTLSKGGNIAWAVRPGNPMFLSSLNGFIEYAAHHMKGKIDQVWKRYFMDTKLIKNPLSLEASGRIKAVSPHFKEAGAKNKLDWLMMMAQGYQESELNQNLRSPRGAVGIMQLLPRTAQSLGYKNITTVKNNIAAGVAYMNFIRQNYFNEPHIPPDARVDFALAAYNAGPTRIQSFRQEAKRRGLNPDRWFDNVERVALDKIGEETVRYVANINKYYIAYRMTHHLDEDKTKILSGAAMKKDTSRR